MSSSSTLAAQAAAEGTLAGFVQRQRTIPTPLPADVRVTGQTAVVTGSNVGLGLEASRQLLQRGLAHLVMAVRSQAKGASAAESLQRAFPDAKVSVWLLDMTSYDSIRSFVDQCASLPRIDIAILNAGVMAPSYATAATGHECTMQVNYLSTVFLAMKLIPLLLSKRCTTASRPPSLTIVGSDIAYTPSLTAPLLAKGPILSKLDSPEVFDTTSNYAMTKFLLVFFIAKLAEFVDPRELLLTVSNPGLTAGTALDSEWPMFGRLYFGTVKYFLARTLEDGASIYLDAALFRGAEAHGSFISDWSIKP